MEEEHTYIDQRELLEENSEKFKETMELKSKEQTGLEESKIARDPVICFLIVKSRGDHDSFYIKAMPVNGSWDDLDDGITIDREDEIIDVIPAPQHTFKVSGLFPCDQQDLPYPDSGIYELLGYEFTGAYHPDWKGLLEDMIKRRKK